MVFALTLSYRGAAYAGWQRQKNAPTVQQTVEEAVSDLLGEVVQITGASRTDAGVHARGQIAHLELTREFPLEGLHHGTNQRLPEDIRVLGACRMPDGFHARKCAQAKEYRYSFIRARLLSPLDSPFALQVSPAIDLDVMRQAAALLIGEHDFTAFALAGGGHRQPVRQIFSLDWIEHGERLELRITGNSFLRGMVRSIVGTLLEVGLGRREVAELRDLLKGRPRSEAGPTAPAHALVLERVVYPQRWRIDPAG